MIDEVLKFLGITTISSGIAFGIIKIFSEKIFENYLQTRIETHKSELEKLNISYQIQFSSLHAERAQIIKLLYICLHDYKLAIIDFFEDDLDKNNPIDHLKFKLNEWTKHAITFNSTFHKYKIFFSNNQVNLINNLDLEINKISNETKKFLSNYENGADQINSILTNDVEFSKIKEKYNHLIENVFLLEKELENQFRALLGVEI